MRNLLSCVFAFDERMGKDIVPTHSLIFIHNQTALNEIFSVYSNLSIVRELERAVKDSIQVLLQASARPWRVSKYHLVHHESQTPDIRFGSISLVFQKLRRHVEWSSTNISHFFPTKDISPGCKAKISNFVVSVFDQNVSRLDISVNIPFVDHDLKTQQNLFKDLNSLWLSEWTLGDLFSEIRVTKLKDNIGICLLYTSPSPRDATLSRMPSSA